MKGISPAFTPLYAVYTMSHLACPFALRCDTQCNIPRSYPGGNEILLLSSCSKDINFHPRLIFEAQTCASFKKELIPARVDLFDGRGHDFTIFPEHGDQLCVNFRASINHEGKWERGLNLRMSKEMGCSGPSVLEHFVSLSLES